MLTGWVGSDRLLLGNDRECLLAGSLGWAKLKLSPQRSSFSTFALNILIFSLFSSVSAWEGKNKQKKERWLVEWSKTYCSCHGGSPRRKSVLKSMICSENVIHMSSASHRGQLPGLPARGDISGNTREWNGSLPLGRGRFKRLFQKKWIGAGELFATFLHDKVVTFLLRKVWPGDFASQNYPTPRGNCQLFSMHFATPC